MIMSYNLSNAERLERTEATPRLVDDRPAATFAAAAFALVTNKHSVGLRPPDHMMARCCVNVNSMCRGVSGQQILSLRLQVFGASDASEPEQGLRRRVTILRRRRIPTLLCLRACAANCWSETPIRSAGGETIHLSLGSFPSNVSIC